MKSAIIGTFNSGSSVLSEIVEKLGADIGRPLWGDHFESLSMKSLLSTWWSEPALVAAVDQPDRIPFLKAWGDHYEQRTGLACLKHPLLCLSAADLDVAWGTDYKAIRAFRPLNDSIERLKRRGWYRGQEERMQNHLFSASEAYFATKDHLRVSYPDLLASPRETVERVAEYLELSCSENTLAEAASFVRPGRS